MGDEGRGQELPQRARGAARGGSTPPAAPVLSEEVRQRMRVAVEAERAEAARQQNKPVGRLRRSATAQAADSSVAD